MSIIGPLSTQPADVVNCSRQLCPVCLPLKRVSLQHKSDENKCQMGGVLVECLHVAQCVDTDSVSPGLLGEPGMPNHEPMQPFCGGQQLGSGVRYSLPPPLWVSGTV